VETHLPPNDGNLLVGIVNSVDPAARTVTMVNCISSPGEGVGYDLTPSGPYFVSLNADAELPAVGEGIAFHAAEGWWIAAPDAKPLTDFERLLIETTDAVSAILDRLTAARDELHPNSDEDETLAVIIGPLMQVHNTCIGFIEEGQPSTEFE